MNELVGKRVLSKIGNRWNGVLCELRVLEVSPSGQYVKLMNMDGKKFWNMKSEVVVVETLEDIERRPS